MKHAFALALILLVGNLVSLALVALAAYLVYLDRGGWGWVLVLAVLAHISPTGKSNKSTTEE
jgi:hypothetical protein